MAKMDETRIHTEIYVGSPLGKHPLRRPKLRWGVYTMKMDLTVRGGWEVNETRPESCPLPGLMLAVLNLQVLVLQCQFFRIRYHSYTYILIDNGRIKIYI